MPNTAPIIPGISICGFAKETVQGTYVAPSFFGPIQTIKPEDLIGYEDDKSLKASTSEVSGVYQTTKAIQFGFDQLGFFETLGNFLVACGFADTVGVGRSVSDGADTSSTTITSATAAFVSGDVGSTITGTDIPAGTIIASVTNGTTAVLSAATTGTGSGRSWVIAGGTGTWQHKLKKTDVQPPTYSITDYDGFETLGYVGCLMDQFDLNIDAKAMVKYMTQWKGISPGTQSKPTPTWPALPPGLGWQIAYTVGGVALPRIESLGVTLKRGVEDVRTSNNTQLPYYMFADRMNGVAKVKALRVDDTERNHVINNDQPVLTATWTSPTGSPAPAVTMTASKTAWKKSPSDRSGKYMQADYDIEFVDNATDGGICQWLIANGVSTPY